MANVNIGDCQFLHGQRRQKSSPTMQCKCGREATQIVKQRSPRFCLEQAARAVLRPVFREDLETYLAANPEQTKRLNPPGGAASAATHKAWRQAAGISVEDYRKDPRRGIQPDTEGRIDIFAAADQILSEIEGQGVEADDPIGRVQPAIEERTELSPDEAEELAAFRADRADKAAKAAARRAAKKADRVTGAKITEATTASA